ncbi:UNVERIFIED_CONTAM: hypothetical protein FKN15_003611 [Acipenser sinensis]
MWDSPLNVMDGANICSEEIAGSATVQAKLYPTTRPPAPGTRKSKRPRRQTQPPDQLFYKDCPLAKLLKTLHENNLNIPVGSNRLALFNMYCSYISAKPVLPPSRHRCPSSPTQPTTSPLTAAAQQPRNTAEEDTIQQIHFNIFEDMKSLIQPITISISAINTRLDDMDKRVASNSAANAIPPGPATETFVSGATPSVPALPGPTADVPTPNLTYAALKSSHEAPAIRNHTLTPHLWHQIIEGLQVPPTDPRSSL